MASPHAEVLELQHHGSRLAGPWKIALSSLPTDNSPPPGHGDTRIPCGCPWNAPLSSFSGHKPRSPRSSPWLSLIACCRAAGALLLPLLPGDGTDPRGPRTVALWCLLADLLLDALGFQPALRGGSSACSWWSGAAGCRSWAWSGRWPLMAARLPRWCSSGLLTLPGGGGPAGM